MYNFVVLQSPCFTEVGLMFYFLCNKRTIPIRNFEQTSSDLFIIIDNNALSSGGILSYKTFKRGILSGRLLSGGFCADDFVRFAIE